MLLTFHAQLFLQSYHYWCSANLFLLNLFLMAVMNLEEQHFHHCSYTLSGTGRFNKNDSLSAGSGTMPTNNSSWAYQHLITNVTVCINCIFIIFASLFCFSLSTMFLMLSLTFNCIFLNFCPIRHRYKYTDPIITRIFAHHLLDRTNYKEKSTDGPL